MRISDVPTLRAGTGRCDITPLPGTPQGGWGAQLHEIGAEADMPMMLTALAIRSGEETCLVVEADAIGFDFDMTLRILEAISTRTGIGKEQIRFSCSHTHSGPNTFRLGNISVGLNLIQAYLEELPNRVAAAAWQAIQRLEPVFCAAGLGQCAINRKRRVRIPEGKVVVGVDEVAGADHALGVVRLVREDRSTLATLVHYACHPTTAGWQNERFTPDYPGPMRTVVEQQLGGHCLFLQGAAGDLGPRRGFTGDLEVYRALGLELGLAAASVALSVDPLHEKMTIESVIPSGANIAQYRYSAHAGPTLCRMISQLVELPIRVLPSEQELAGTIAEQRAEVQRLRATGQTQEMLLAQARATQMGWKLENARRYGGKATTAWPMQVLRLGDIAFVSMAGEPFSSIACRIRTESPVAHTFVSGYSNGGFGYIPDRKAYGEGGYEIEATPFAEGSDDLVVEAALRMIDELFEENIAQ